MPGKLLVTGGAGFIGSNFIKYLIDEFDYSVINLDALTYAGNPENLADIRNHSRYHFVKGSICNRGLLEYVFDRHNIDGVINFAAESHVDRSILDSRPFVETNIAGTTTLLDLVREFDIPRFVQISTDEVYGSLGSEGKFTESSPIRPNSPYSASKAAADHIVMSYVNTFGVDASITRCSNNYGPYQFPEKLIPLMISNAMQDKPLPVYGDGMNVRDWIHTSDHCRAIELVYRNGRQGEVYNIGGDSEKTNIEIVRLILKKLGKSENLITYVKDRPGHDHRYAIDASKIKNELNWQPRISFEEGLESTIQWYIDNIDWTERIKTGEYLEYYSQQYENR